MLAKSNAPSDNPQEGTPATVVPLDKMISSASERSLQTRNAGAGALSRWAVISATAATGREAWAELRKLQDIGIEAANIRRRDCTATVALYDDREQAPTMLDTIAGA